MSASLQICTVPDVLREKLKAFRFSKSQDMNALIVKVNRESQTLVIEEHLEDCTLDDVRAELPEQQPRFVLLSYALKHRDGRLSYPLCLIFYSPSGCSPEQQMMYAGSRNLLVKEGQLTKNFEIRDADELTQEYVDSKAI